MKKMTKIGYARVSTYKQLKTGTSLKDQIHLLKNIGCKKIFAEQFTGTKKSRPKWNKCNQYLRDGDTLCIIKIDRLGRDMTNILDTVRDLTNRGIKIVSLKPQKMIIDNKTMMGKMALGMFAIFSDLEHSMITQRLSSGKEYLLEQGDKLANGGRPNRLSKRTPKARKKYKNYKGIYRYFKERRHLQQKDPKYYSKYIKETPAQSTANTFGISRQTVYNVFNTFKNK